LTGNPRGVLYSIAPSPLQAGMVWTGSDTGLIHLTRNGGKTWENVTPKGLPAWSNVTHIEASHFDPAEAYAAVDRHQMDDYKPYVYRTRDYGKTWTPAGGGPGGAGVFERHSGRSGAERTAVRGHRAGRRCFL